MANWKTAITGFETAGANHETIMMIINALSVTNESVFQPALGAMFISYTTGREYRHE